MPIEARGRDRVKAGVATFALEGLLAYALFTAMTFDTPVKATGELKIFNIAVMPEKRPVKKPVRPAVAAAGSPRARREERVEAVATNPVQLAAPPAIVAALEAATGGADGPQGADAAGQGPGGTGGEGSGTARNVTLPLWRSGEVKDSDYPRDAWEAGIGGTVAVRYVVAPSGRATGCEVIRSSGSASLDSVTCRLIERRFRFRPSRDAQGHAIPAIVTEEHDWSAT